MDAISFGVVTPIAADGEIFQHSVTIGRVSVDVDVTLQRGKVVVSITFNVPRPFVYLMLVSEDFIVRSSIGMKRRTLHASVAVRPEFVQESDCWTFYIHLTNMAYPSTKDLQDMDKIYQAY
ncbi:hypothetical protein BG006_011328 [Podila minutissima]|uniref:Uncharacterized protein n=1 Tax=Podila minutissima TaxID=64525 RepID=A0A9P5SCL4_9FUNG|nr:hypothetical protein BG006_011328 [Podila minutissima]